MTCRILPAQRFVVFRAHQHPVSNSPTMVTIEQKSARSTHTITGSSDCTQIMAARRQ